MGMLISILRLLASKTILLFIVSILAHAVIHLAPGEPSEVDPANPRMKPEDVALIRAAFHLDEPLYKQYGLWIRDLATGELKSQRDGLPVVAKIGRSFMNSLPLFICSSLLIWTLSFPIGIHGALQRGSVFDRSSTVIAYALISIPGFVFSYLVILWVVRIFEIPVIGMFSFGLQEASWFERAMDRLWHLALPAIISALGGIAILSRYVRSQMVEVLDQDYIRTATAKGLPRVQLVYRHALRNALLPAITMFGLLLPGLIGGSVIFEQIFAWPGIGRLGYQAILARDYPVILTLNLFAAALTILGTTLADLLYTLADPRVNHP